MSEIQQDDALKDAYRRASARDADRPSAATRAAILAEAASAARRNAPAANDSSYWPRAVAAIAVVGIGLVLWRQTDYRMPDDAAAVVEAPAKKEMLTEAERAPLPEKAAESAPAARERAADSPRADAVVKDRRPPPQPFPAPAISPSPPLKAETGPPPLARNTDDEELEETSITGTRIQMPTNERTPAAQAAPPAVAGRAPLRPDGMALLRQYFPAQDQSDAPHPVWLVLNAAGEVLQSGELAPGQRLADLGPQLASALGNRVPGPWQVQILRNTRGQPIELAIALLP